MAIDLHDISIIPVGSVQAARAPSAGTGLHLAVARSETAREDRRARRTGQSAAVRELLAIALAETRGPEARNWTLAREATGRPVLAGPDAPAVSLAHREDWLACAIGTARGLGVDIEVMRNRDWAAVADQVLAAGECDWMLAARDAERCQRGYRLWTLKEAFVKAANPPSGFSLPDVVFDPAGKLVACPAGCGRPEDWQSRHWQWSATVCVALVWRD